MHDSTEKPQAGKFKMADSRGEKRKLVPQNTASPTRRRISDMTVDGSGGTEKKQEESKGKREKDWEMLVKKMGNLKRLTEVKLRHLTTVFRPSFPLSLSLSDKNENDYALLALPAKIPCVPGYLVCHRPISD